MISCPRPWSRAGADELVADAAALADRLADGVAAHGLVEHPDHGQIWAYEVDGLGHHLLMDDANMPGLMSLPLVAGIAVDDPLYRRTRAFVLSEDNPFYYRGRVAAGVGSPHTPERYVWPIALAVEGLTSESPERALELLHLIASTTAGTGHVHEGFDVDDDTRVHPAVVQLGRLDVLRTGAEPGLGRRGGFSRP